jgi:transposase InsO family protein
METQLEHKINVSRLDNNRDFISKEVKHFCKEHGIEKQISAPFRLQ